MTATPCFSVPSWWRNYIVIIIPCLNNQVSHPEFLKIPSKGQLISIIVCVITVKYLIYHDIDAYVSYFYFLFVYNIMFILCITQNYSGMSKWNCAINQPFQLNFFIQCTKPDWLMNCSLFPCRLSLDAVSVSTFLGWSSIVLTPCQNG